MSTQRWLLLLIVAGALLRIGLWATYAPIEYPDTGSYRAAAQDLLEGNLSRSEGRRTPGYPLVVAIAGTTPNAVWLMQMLGGMAISVLLFYIALQLTRRPGFAFAVGMTYNLNLAQLFFEATLLSESVTTLSVVAVVAVLVAALRRLREERRATGMLLLLGFLSGFAILVRAQFVFLPLLLPALVAYASLRPRFRPRFALGNSILTIAPAAIMVLVWCAAVYVKTGYFTLSTQSGLGFSNASIGFTEYAPDRYAAIRDILVKHRDARRARGDPDYNTMWEALPEIEEKTGMSLPEVSRAIQRMSLELFVAHPVKYARNVAESWISFWLAPNPWKPDRLSPGWLARPLVAIWWVEHKALRLVNALFVLLVAAVALSRRMRERTRWDLELTSVSAIILASSVIQALPEYGASARYGVTVQALTVLVVMVAALRFRQTTQRLAATPATA